jgi:hypothetical protein
MTYLHQFPKIKLRSFQDLDLTDENILKWVDARCSLLNLFSNHLRDKLAHKLFQITGCCLVDHNFPHLPTDLKKDKRQNMSNISHSQNKGFREI